MSVRNYGIHPAYAAGTLRIYTAGSLIFSTTILSGLIQPGDTKDALALDYWTPPAPGTYMCIAHVDTDHDQNLSNNDLAPVTFSVSGLPPPPPPGVTPHAAQHEEDAADEIDLDGLRGVLKDPQTAAAHKDSHQLGGSDELSVDGLSGILKDGQAIADHHATHEGDGDDELNVDDLHGVLYNKQKPQTHANEAHDPNFSADPHGASDHNTSVEATANKGQPEGYAGLDDEALVNPTNLGGDPSGLEGQHLLAVDAETDPMLSWQPAADLEHTANKGEAGGYAELDEFSHVPAAQLGAVESSPPEPLTEVLHRDQTWRNPAPAEPTAHHETHEPGGSDVLSGIAPLAHHESHEDGGDDELSIAGLSGKAADAQDPTAHKTTHEDGGADELSIAGLSGKAADAQDPVGHHTSHEPGGSDPITALLAPKRVAYCQEPTAVSWDGRQTYLAIGDKTWSNVYESLIGNKQVEFDIYFEITCSTETYLLVSIGSGAPGVYYFGSSNYTAGVGTTIIHFRARLSFYLDGQGYSTAECGQTLHACAPWGSVTKVNHGGPNQMPPGNLNMGIMITHDQPASPPTATIANGQIILWPID